MQRTEAETALAPDEFDLQNFTRAFTRRWRLIAGVTAFTTLLAVYMVLTSPPMFTATGTVFLGTGDNNSTATDQTNFLSDYQVYSSVNAAVELLQSQSLIEQAVLETGLNATIVPVGKPPMTYSRWRFVYGKTIDTFAPTPATLIAPFAVFGDPGAQGAAFRIVFGKGGNFSMITPGTWFSPSRQVGTGEWGKPTVVEGAAFLLKAAVGSAPPPEGSAYDVSIVPAKLMAQAVLGSLTVAATGPAVSPTNVASVQFVWNNPYSATVFVQRLMEDFIQSQSNWATESASNTETYVSQQLNKISAALEDANKSQAYYQSKTGIVDVDTNSQAVVSQLSAYQSQRSTLLLQQEALQQLVKSLSKGGPSAINPYLVTQSNDPVLSGLATTLANAEVTLEDYETRFGKQSPEIRRQVATINQIEGAIGQLVSNDEVIAGKNLANIDALIAQYQTQLKSVPAESLKVGELSRSVDVLGTLYQLLMQKEEEAEVSKAATTDSTRIVDPAELPIFASAPRPSIMVVAGVVLGLLAGFGIVLMQRAFSGKFRTEAEIRNAMPSSIYGVVPRRGRAELKSGIFSQATRSPFKEAFRMLESKLAALQVPEQSRIILVTSATEFDGKTTIAANIAKVLADGGRRVLLVDADLECGNLNGSLGIAAGPGLAEALRGGLQPQIVKGSKLNFSLLRAGHTNGNSQDALNLAQVKALLTSLREEFDFIILDSPPLPLVSDALVLANFADLILSVARVEHTPRRDFAAHCELLAGTNCLYGIIINGSEVGEGANYEASKRGRRHRLGWRRRLQYAFAGLVGRGKPQGRPAA